MHIVHVIHSIDPRSGGPSNSLRGLLGAQKPLGYAITLVTTSAQSAEPWAPRDEYVQRMRSDAAFDGVNLLIGNAWGRRRPWSRFSYCPHTVALLRHVLQDPRRRPDLVHIHGAFSHLTIRAAQLARRFRIPYVFRPAGSFDATCLRKGMRLWKRLFIACFHRRDLRAAAAVHVTSQAEADHLSHAFPGVRTVVIPHGVAVPAKNDALALPALFGDTRAELSDRKVILFLARLHEIKRPSWLLHALASLSSEHENLALAYVGPDAGERRRLTQLGHELGVQDRVTFFGFLTGPDKSYIFEAAHVYCLPSQHENFGVAVIEAMAHGVPVVVTPGVASHVYVDAAGCGVTTDDSLESFTDGIRQILEADRDELGLRGRRYVEQHLTWPAVARRIDQLYHDVLTSTQFHIT
ncbi:glycosyltransferase [Thermostilla marina]